MIARLLLGLALLLSSGCAPGGCEGEAAGRTWVGGRRHVPAGGGGGLSILQSLAFDDGGSSTSKTVTPAVALTAGSALVWLVRSETTTSAVNDGTNSYTHPVTHTAAGQYLDAFVAANNAASGTPAVTLAVAANYTLWGGVFLEIGGANTSSPVETSATTTNGYGTDRYGGSITVAGSALALGWYLDPNTGLDDATYGLTPDATWTRIPYTGTAVNLGVIYKLVTAGTYNPHGTTTTAYGANLGAAIAIK